MNTDSDFNIRTQKSGEPNERPDFPTRRRNELRQLLLWRAASDYSGGNRLCIRQFDFVGHNIAASRTSPQYDSRFCARRAECRAIGTERQASDGALVLR